MNTSFWGDKIQPTREVIGNPENCFGGKRKEDVWSVLSAERD